MSIHKQILRNAVCSAALLLLFVPAAAARAHGGDPALAPRFEAGPAGLPLMTLPADSVQLPDGRILMPAAGGPREDARASAHEGWLRLDGALLRPEGFILLRPADLPRGKPAFRLADGSLLLGRGLRMRPDGTTAPVPAAGVALADGRRIDGALGVAAQDPPATRIPVVVQDDPAVFRVIETRQARDATEAVAARAAARSDAEAALAAAKGEAPAAGAADETFAMTAPPAAAQDAPAKSFALQAGKEAEHNHTTGELRWSSIQDACCIAGGSFSNWSAGDAWYENIELGITMDMLGEFSEVDNPSRADAPKFDRYNRFRVRSLQLHGAARLDWVGWAYAAIDVSDGGDGSDFILREAAAWIDALPGGFSLRAGKYYADFGTLNRYYLNELVAPNMDGVRPAYLGGNLTMTGVELHQRNEFDSSVLRFSVGAGSEFESHHADAPDNGIDDTPDTLTRTRRRGIDNWAGTARAEWDTSLWQGWGARFGASGFYAPRQPQFTAVAGKDGILGSADDRLARADLEHTVLSGDFTLVWEHDEESFDSFTTEALWDHADLGAGTGARARREASLGAWVLWRHVFDPHWSIGAMTSVWQKPDIQQETQARFM
ncbi:MAG TPA: hypothetical protein VGC54_02960, partial [Planctomycetota bacterium]